MPQADEIVVDRNRKGAAQTATQEKNRSNRNRAWARVGARPHVEIAGTAETETALRIAVSRIWGWITARWVALLACRPYTDKPASIRDVVTYTLAGGWVSGEREWYKELPGYIYGGLIAIPVTIILNSTLWVLQRPMRVMAVALILALFKWGV